MATGRRHKARTPGLAPGSLAGTAAPGSAPVRIALIDYDEGRVEEREVADVPALGAYRKPAGVTWINVVGVHDPVRLEALGALFGVHPLCLEDIAHTAQRPKFEDYTDYFYVVLQMIRHLPGTQATDVEQISLLLGPGYVVSFQEREGDVFDPVRARIRSGKGRIRKLGADYLLYALVDAIVDHYFLVLEELGTQIEAAEDRLLARPEPAVLHDIHRLKTELLFLRKAVWPLRDALSGLERAESPLVQPPTRLFFRDVYDHCIRVIDTVETSRELVAGLLDIYLSSVSNRMNEVMKVLTIIATIFIPLTFVAGVYGMNFTHMPELDCPWAYPAVWLVMLAMAGGMVLYFRRKKWL
jgi:magnesium transporter